MAHEGGGGRCPVDGRAHDPSGSANYHIPHTRTRHAGQPGWRWCDKCQGLFHGPSGGGRCPGGGAHNLQAQSAAYFVVPEAASRDFGGQNGWRYCQGCHGLFFGGGGVGSVCPAGGAHNGAASGDYVLDNR